MTSINSVCLHANEFGQGTPVVILHGLFGSARNWQTFAQKLAMGYRVFTLDLRNHGQSPHHAHMTYEDIAADVVKFLDDQDITEAVLIGHSMGGKTAMKIALEYPQRVNHLLIIDIAPVAYSHNYDELLANLDRLDLTAISRRTEANKLLAEVIDDDDLRLFLLQNLVVKPGERTYWRINLEAIRANVDHLVRYVPEKSIPPFLKPADLIRGSLSQYVQNSHLANFKALFPAITMHTIEGAGHWPHAQRAEDFLNVVQTILTRNR